MDALDGIDQLIKQQFAGWLPKGFYKTFMARADASMLEAALMKTHGNQIRAAKLLGIDRKTLKAKLIKYGMTTK